MSLYDAIAEQPWAITEPALRQVVEVAGRRNLSPEAVEAQRGEPLDNTARATVRDGVASIPVRGPIFRYANLFTRVSGATSTQLLATDFGAALDDPEVRAILLEVDSPGGQAAGIGELATIVASARGVKPVVAYVSGSGCSAAYWIASAADRVVAAPSAIIGSIGALVMIDRRGPDEREPIVVVSSQSPEKYHDPESVKGQREVQAIVDSLAAVFIEDVAANRGVTPDDVMSRYGKGGVFVGREALSAGLVDAIGTYEQVHAELAGRAVPQGKRTPRKEPAMSEQQNPPVAGANEPDYKALAERYKADADASFGREAAANAKAYVSDLAADRKITPGEREGVAALLAQAAADDRANPVAGSPSSRQDALKAALQARPQHNLTREVAAADPAGKTRALASDPADVTAANPEQKDLDGIAALASGYGKQLNGSK